MVKEILITTELDPQGYLIKERFGVVFGVSVFSRNVLGNFFGSIRAIFGGEQSGYAKMIMKNRDNAIEKLVENARNLGANAVIGVRFDSNEFDSGKGQSMNEVVVYGTAVILEKK
ncbi:MAG TPA: YbjQ family protein [Thermodesulfobium narugense]|uniref:YbjQ family protein n=1 Tax=Thermodesulfobium acidiphilum TaxID=1794699 RepID=UPI000CC31A6A|nr:MAG: YbjQ family protein [Thermodesulfobium narugense]HEM56353.1 YbjQ family protein [Thermodesulfobium narugense]